MNAWRDSGWSIFLFSMLLVGCDSGRASGETTAGECADGRDNDGDGAIDCRDFGCAGHAFCASTGADAGGPPPSCAPSSCGGCCSGDTCLGGNSAAACGVAGAICLDCGPGRLCSGGACVIDPASRWDLIVGTVSVSSVDVSGAAWDAFGGAPDPFVEAYVGGASGYVGVTGSGADVFSVRYDRVIATSLRADALRGYLAFVVWDEDASSHDPVGACRYEPLDPVAFDGAVQTMECRRDPANAQAGFTLTWQLRRS